MVIIRVSGRVFLVGPNNIVLLLYHVPGSKYAVRGADKKIYEKQSQLLVYTAVGVPEAS